MAPKLIHHPPTIGDKIVETLYSSRTKQESQQKNPHPSPVPSIQSWGVCCFLQVARTSALHCVEGMGEEKLYFLLLKPVKRKKSPVQGQSVSTRFVADCSFLACATEELNFLLSPFLLSPSGKNRQNPYSGPSPVYQDLNTRHGWPLSICQSG